MEKIIYFVESNDYGNLWKSETGGVFVVSDRPVDFPTDTDAREAAIEYARVIRGVGMRTRVKRKTEEIVFDSSSDS